MHAASAWLCMLHRVQNLQKRDHEECAQLCGHTLSHMLGEGCKPEEACLRMIGANDDRNPEAMQCQRTPSMRVAYVPDKDPAPEIAVSDNLCNIGQPQVISYVWLVTAILLHGICMGHCRYLLW